MNKIEKLLDKLMNIRINLNEINNTYHEIQNIYFEIFNDHLKQIKKSELKKGANLYRVRKGTSKLISKPSEISYPPANCVKNLGRFNLTETPMYYCTEDSRVAILESKPLVGDFITLSHNVISNDMRMAVTSNSHRYKDLTNDETLNIFYDKITLLTNKVVENPIDYIFTATLGNIILSDKSFDGILYPSIYSKGLADNLALRVEELNKYLKFQSVRQFKVIEKTNSHNIKIICVAKAEQISANGDFIWSKINNCKTHYINFDIIPLSLNE